MQTIARNRIEVIARHYLIAAIWADCEEGTNPKPSAQAKRAAFNICNTFVHRYPALFARAMDCATEGYGSHPDAGSAEASFGHDLWLTTRGHGTGFWDRDELPQGLREELHTACRQFGEPEYWQARGWFYIAEGASVRALPSTLTGS